MTRFFFFSACLSLDDLDLLNADTMMNVTEKTEAIIVVKQKTQHGSLLIVMCLDLDVTLLDETESHPHRDELWKRQLLDSELDCSPHLKI